MSKSCLAYELTVKAFMDITNIPQCRHQKGKAVPGIFDIPEGAWGGTHSGFLGDKLLCPMTFPEIAENKQSLY